MVSDRWVECSVQRCGSVAIGAAVSNLNEAYIVSTTKESSSCVNIRTLAASASLSSAGSATAWAAKNKEATTAKENFIVVTGDDLKMLLLGL